MPAPRKRPAGPAASADAEGDPLAGSGGAALRVEESEEEHSSEEEESELSSHEGQDGRAASHEGSQDENEKGGGDDAPGASTSASDTDSEKDSQHEVDEALLDLLQQRRRSGSQAEGRTQDTADGADDAHGDGGAPVEETDSSEDERPARNTSTFLDC